MPSGDYAITGGGALKLKGAKVQKKKKKRKDKSDLEKNLSTGHDGVIVKKTNESPPPADNTGDQEEDGQVRDDEVPEARKTESERRYEEVKKKRVSQTSAHQKITSRGTKDVRHMVTDFNNKNNTLC